MTLVIQYCTEQIENRLFYDPLRVKMPCVYEGEPLDFESALVNGEWPALKDITSEYEQSDDSNKTAPGAGERSPSKRKHIAEASCESEASEAKKPCTGGYLASSFAEASHDSQSSPSPSSSCLAQQEAAEEEDEQYLPRRRGPQMWNSRQRLKDERKKVLKMSVTKLQEVEDPELLLWRSVLINNTIKRLHHEIRTERQAKIRHRQQKVDFFHDRYEPPATAYSESKKPSAPSDIYDDSSCDEIFGISEDFLRVTIPDRRLSSSPVPPNLGRPGKDSSDMDVDPPQSSGPSAFTARPPTNSSPRHGGSLCATQYRTNESGNDTTFPPRVPILDSVVYHSLLASLESS